jgi:beta-lactamase class A
VGNTSHGATARQVARFLVMMDQGMLVSPWASNEMKSIRGNPLIKHKFVAGLSSRPGSRIFRKSGTWKHWHADAALVERDGKKYVAVALAESSSGGAILSSLILHLDDLVMTGRPVVRGAQEGRLPDGRDRP